MSIATVTRERTPVANQDLELVQLSQQSKIATLRELRQATDNVHGLALIENADQTRCIAIKTVDGRDVITVDSPLTREQFNRILEKMLPIPETRGILFDLAVAYANRTPIMLEGGTAIGKTYAVNRFAEFLYGPDAKIPDFYCNGQTDVSELMGKYVPAGLRPDQLRALKMVLDSDAGAALRADMQQGGTFTQQDLLERAALELKLPIQRGSFTFQLGVLPKAMTGTMSPEGIMLETADGPGCMLHIQEVGMAAPSVVNALLKIRGEKGKLATDIQVHEDGGRLIKAGRGFFVVFSTNPPGQGFKERFEVDPALARALDWKTYPDQLSSESMDLVGSWIFDCSKVERRPDAPGAIVDLRQHPQLTPIIKDVVINFHRMYAEKLVNGESGRKQRIPVTIDSLWKVAELLQNHQQIDDADSRVDFVATLKSAIRSVYIDPLRDKSNEFGCRSLEDASKKQTSLGATLMEVLDLILSDEALGTIEFEGSRITRRQAIEILEKRVMQPGESHEGEAAAQAVILHLEKQELGESLDDLRITLGDSKSEGLTSALAEMRKRMGLPESDA